MKGGIPKFCNTCRVNPVAWTNPRVDFCYQCLPGGPFTPPPCRQCGSAENYYSAGLCGLCHPAAPQRPGSCRDCFAWGVVRKHKWLCWGCRSWRTKFSVGVCVCCRREITIDDTGACRLCWRQAALLRWAKTGLTLVEANRHGQQLFLANLHQRGNRAKPAQSRRPEGQAALVMPAVPRPVPYRQLVLFDAPRDLAAGKRAGFPPPPEPELAAALQAALREHAARHGWSEKTLKRSRRALDILLGLQDTPGGPIKTSLIHQLPLIELPEGRLRDFLGAIDFLEDDRTPAVEEWLNRQLDGLPEPMATEIRQWFTIAYKGHFTAPRTKPRAQGTVRIKLAWALPTLRSWAASGVTSLREISREDVLTVLPPSGNPRYTAGAGLRAIFTVLKAHKVVFINPTSRIPIGAPSRTQPLPADLAVVREGLHAPDPTRAAMTALLAFHGLAPGELRALTLTDIRDGRLYLPERTILLADAVRIRLRAYLDYRNQRWPQTANPHLFIHRRTALDVQPVGGRWLALVLGTAARVLRTDRILEEVRASGGDARRICDLFGMSVKAAERYTATLEHPDLARPLITDERDAGR